MKKIRQLDSMETEFLILDKMISALLGTYSAECLHADVVKARAIGLPYDAYRKEHFAMLALKLQSYFFEKRISSVQTGQARQNFAFFDAYFSNFIEGTEFEIEEAKAIIFDHQISS